MDSGGVSDSGGDSSSPPDSGDIPVPGVIGFVVVALLVLICCWGKFKRVKRREDEEELEPRDEVNGWSLFFCCSEGEDSSSMEDRRSQQLSPVHTAVSSPKHTTAIATVDTPGKVGSESIKNALRHLQAAVQSESKDESAKIVRQAQTLILAKNVKPTENSLQTCLVIGVDARPSYLGGYCVNLRDLTMEYYVIKMEDFPWPMDDQNNPDEFEMKNLVFALSLWGKSIRKYNSFRIYTDNDAIDDEESEFGADAGDLLEHFTGCEDVKKVNEQEHVHRKLKLEQFAIYIQPADDFSRWEIEKGIEFLCMYYGIDRKNVHGTHKLMRQETSGSRAWYDPSGNYNHYIQRATSFATNFKCENCIITTFLEFQMAPPGPNRGRDASSVSRTRSRSQSQPRGRNVSENQNNGKRQRRKRHKSQPQQNNGTKKFWLRK